MGRLEPKNFTFGKVLILPTGLCRRLSQIHETMHLPRANPSKTNPPKIFENFKMQLKNFKIFKTPLQFFKFPHNFKISFFGKKNSCKF